MNVANAEWLKGQLRDHGWFKVSAYGADADTAAWLIVQHARYDTAFQQEVVAMLEPLLESGETKGGNFAMLYDQAAHYAGRPGRFGTMGACTALASGLQSRWRIVRPSMPGVAKPACRLSPNSLRHAARGVRSNLLVTYASPVLLKSCVYHPLQHYRIE